MIRFIVNFILFGILFYLIYHFFPDTFQVLVSWAERLYEIIKDLSLQLYSKLSSVVRKSPLDTGVPHHEALFGMIKNLYGR